MQIPLYYLLLLFFLILFRSVLRKFGFRSYLNGLVQRLFIDKFFLFFHPSYSFVLCLINFLFIKQKCDFRPYDLHFQIYLGRKGLF